MVSLLLAMSPLLLRAASPSPPAKLKPNIFIVPATRQPDAIASVIAVWSIDRSDGVSTVVGTGHEMVCRGKIRSGPMQNCSDACRRTPLCRAFVSW